MSHFEITTHGKWILAGEHAVIRHGTALVFPLLGKHFHLKYNSQGVMLNAEFLGDHGSEYELLFWGVLESACGFLKIEREGLSGHFILDSNLPVGAGLGASAALCGAVAKWCIFKGWIPEAEAYTFARRLENLFHGESSGVDIAVALNPQPLVFKRGIEPKVLKLNWVPHLYLSYSGRRGMTKDCVQKVGQLFKKNLELAMSLDQQMDQAVHQAIASLSQKNGLDQLSAALDLAVECFKNWGLINSELQTHMTDLKSRGALATKPTGSGDGGFVLSLWSTPQTHNDLIYCF